MTRKQSFVIFSTSSFPISRSPSTSSFCSFLLSLPKAPSSLYPQSFSPQPTAQPHPPPSHFRPTHLPPLTSVTPSCHPTLMTSTPSSFPVSFISTAYHPVRLALLDIKMALITLEIAEWLSTQLKIIKNSDCFLVCVFNSAAKNANLLSSPVSVTEDNSNAWLMAQGK